jgi:2-oxoglutarate dehydrogenase E2 component (dihydrolipoamide succinyltransferase)
MLHCSVRGWPSRGPIASRYPDEDFMAGEKVVDVVLPSIGESIVEASIKQWFVKQGDVIRADQIIVSISSEKTDVDLPANVAGRVAELLAKEGDTLPIGALIARVEAGVTEAAAPAPAPAPAATAAPLASPSVRQLAREHGVDLSAVAGSGDHGRITQADVLSKAAPAAPAPTPAPAPAPARPAAAPASAPAGSTFSLSLGGGFGSFKAPPYVQKPGDQIVPFSRKRRITADHMVYSKLTSPHVVTVAEVDLHGVMKHREAFKAQYKKEGVNLTVLSYVCLATVKALRAFPGINARVLDGATALLKDINLGVAVDAPDGLVVPNIKHADELSLKGMARSIGELAARARDNKLMPDDFSGATFTVTNPGPKGNLFGGAIISQPNAAILRMGEIKKRVVVIEENGEDRIVIHPVMYIALSYDHRIIDGVLGNDFLWTIADLLRKGQFEA